jgi:hypothetical protein
MFTIGFGELIKTTTAAHRPGPIGMSGFVVSKVAGVCGRVNPLFGGSRTLFLGDNAGKSVQKREVS